MDPHASTSAAPWDVPGAVRRDCLPHRGDRLLFLGNWSFVCGLMAGCVLFTAAPGLPMGVAAFLLAWGDLKQMRAGQMDPTGRAKTRRALWWGAWGTALSLFFCGLVFLAIEEKVMQLHFPGWSLVDMVEAVVSDAP